MWSLLELFPERFLIDVLDIGAALNDRPPYQSLVDAGRARIVGLEPDTEECDRLNREYGQPHRFLPFFAGDGRAAVFHETSWALTGSLFEPNTPLMEKFQNLAELAAPVAQHAVDTTRIDDIGDLGNIDFIKIDVQGAELAILENAQRVLSGTLLIQAEVEFVELYRGQPLFADVDRFLRSRGFQFLAFNGFGSRVFKPLVFNGDVNAAGRQYLWSDALYVRDWMRLAELEPDKLGKYAVLAHDVLHAFDLAHLVLEALDRKSGSRLGAAYLERLTRNGEQANT